MEDLREKAISYAEENVINVLKEAFAKVFADGYRDGYKDRTEEISVIFRDGNTEFVDLDLPSGTLWSKEYEKDNGKCLYLPYLSASKFNLPTEEQWNELLTCCKWNYTYITSSLRKFDCIGPNGNFITFYSSGFTKTGATFELPAKMYFWLNSQCDDENNNNAIIMDFYYNNILKLEKIFSGFRLPIRLVRTKE